MSNFSLKIEKNDAERTIKFYNGNVFLDKWIYSHPQFLFENDCSFVKHYKNGLLWKLIFPYKCNDSLSANNTVNPIFYAICRLYCFYYWDITTHCDC